MISLRPTTAADLPALFAQQADPASIHMAAFTVKDPFDRAAFDAKWTRLLGDPSVVSRTIILADPANPGLIVGQVAKFDMLGEPNITYGVVREYWNRGIASRALALFLVEHTPRPLFARAAADNASSRRVLERCGFTQCGTERGFASARNAEIDEVVYTLTA